MTDCLLVGGGIIGLSLAYELSRRGMTVTLVEQGDWGGQASSAAAGMLAPLKEFSKPGDMLELGVASLRLYPEWVSALQEVSGADVQATPSGVLTVALTEEETASMEKKYRWQKEAGYNVQWMSAREMQELEPLITEHAMAGIYSREEGHINNRLLLAALVLACRNQGVKLLSGCVVTGMATEGTRVVGVQTAAGKLLASHTVITSGAWAGIMAGWLQCPVPIRPVRGQVAAVSSIGFPLQTVIFGTTGYITPKRDGKIVLGATEDEAGFQREVTLSGLTHIVNGVRPYVPALQTAAFLEAWAGLRPATADGKPLLGPVPGWQGISIAAGHFRNGILLSPITAKVMADYLESGQAEPLASFSPARFVQSPAAI
ncbi:glycine oxidase ThiO [Brevibacillus ruminantium]|uniref:glycine oxidase n=1 Tax=Brevibacillus ruminantium TaxID=2950604 RepID=A0ABY4WD95_9BACL|nr:glycine oxidase ThiO [Brevibacillus ruminantium]USG64869.1 glycine oxidase ThiO [Brevibacillus ruminantium]